MAQAKAKTKAKSAGAPQGTYVALLRGINVSGNNRLLMKDLAAACEACGCVDVRTYIQSGNVVFACKPAAAAQVAAKITARLADDFGVNVPVILRSAAALARVAEANPFLAAGADVDRQYVMFLADTPAPSKVAALDPQRSPGDRFAVVGSEIFLHLPNGAGRSKLTAAYFDAKLATISTARNWRTLLTLIAMTRAS
jgi:uncharacterized protein (DUF1697 family)